jgi:hypothetical protein
LRVVGRATRQLQVLLLQARQLQAGQRRDQQPGEKRRLKPVALVRAILGASDKFSKRS